MTWTITLEADSYEAARDSFGWDEIPDDYNIARDCLGKHDDPETIALYQKRDAGDRIYTFRDLDERSNQLAHGLAARGVEAGDRVAVVVPQKAANLLTHLACWKLGAVSVPLSVLFGDDALAYRMRDAGVEVAVVDGQVEETVARIRGTDVELPHVVSVHGEGRDDFEPFDAVCNGEPTTFALAETDVDTPAIVIYTSGSTGPPKGVVHGHGVWLGHCPAFYMYFERDVANSVFWTPADWAWIGALGDLVFPAWHYGRPVVGYPMGSFDATRAFGIMDDYGVTDAFLPPTAIRMMMDVDDPAGEFDLSLKAICSGGEPLTPEILDWAAEELEGVAVNELYGQTEANLLVTNCRDWFEPQAGSMGKPVPGHDVAVVDAEDGTELGPDEVGTIAVERGDDPVVFQEYWNQPEKTAEATVGDWHLTGDLGWYDEDGYFWFKARDDDVIITAGYRVGPGEVESAILEHPDVAQAGVVGVPDETRGEIIKAVVEPANGVSGDDELRESIRTLVRDDLAKHEYPRAIEFVDELPQTTTGKIQRRKLREAELED